MPTDVNRRSALALAVMLTLLLAGCATSGDRADPARADKPRAGGSVTVAGSVELDGFDIKIPARQSGNSLQVMAGVWQGVWRVTPDFRFELNTDLMVSADMTSVEPQTVVYKIRPEAVWSDGVALTADDFIYNWQASRPGAVDVDGSPVQSVATPGNRDAIASVTGSDGGKTVTVVYREKTAQWQTGLTFNTLVPAHVARKVGWNHGFDRFDPGVLVSSGPFRIAAYNPGSDLTLVRNERYWGTPAKLDRVVFRFVGEAEAVNALKNGEVDLVQIGGPGEDLLAQLEQLPGVVHTVSPSLSHEYRRLQPS